MSKEKPEGWKSISVACLDAGVAIRTGYNWAKAKKLEVRVVDGVTLVDPAVVAALARDRAATKPASAGNANGMASGMATGTRIPAAHDGALAARLFAAFDSGKSPAEVVRELELPPRLVLDLWKAHQDLAEVGRPGRPSVADRVATLERDLASLLHRFDEVTLAGMIGEEVRDLRACHNALRDRADALPVPPRAEFTCTCGATGWVETHVRCTACGRNTTWGFQPSRS